MVTRYKALAGQSVERLDALSDGLFAVAMTLLVLDMRVPASAIDQSAGRRIFAARALYASGALPRLFSIYRGIADIISVQVHYVAGPRVAISARI
jgi:hypothetical protein